MPRTLTLIACLTMALTFAPPGVALAQSAPTPPVVAADDEMPVPPRGGGCGTRRPPVTS